MSYTLSQRSMDNLEGVHPDLIQVVKLAITMTEVDFIVIEGMRTLERQKELKAKGASQTLNSRHLTGHAVDLAAWVDGEVRWDWPLYYKIAETVKLAAQKLGVPIEWGGDWKSFKDGPHWQLPWDMYPKKEGHARSYIKKPVAPAGATKSASELAGVRNGLLVRMTVLEDEVRALRTMIENAL